MRAFFFLTLGILLFLIIMYLIVKKGLKESKPKRGNTIAKKMDAMKKEEEKSHLGQRLFYRIKSGLFKK